MRKILNTLIIISFFAQLGCGVVQRWTLNSQEAKSASLDAQRSSNIFYDFLWTTPPIQSHELLFTQNASQTAGQTGGEVAEFGYAGQNIRIVKNAQNQLAVEEAGHIATFVSSVPSQNNVYYDMNALGTKIIPRQRLVTKTRYVTRYENVQKTRMVNKMVPVQKSRSVSYTNATGTTSYRTEYYTVNEMKMVSETYYTMEPVRRMETYTEWETVYESFIDIPVYDVYTLSLSDGANLLVYRVEGHGTQKYYVQNPQYLVASDANGYWGGANTKILAIDTNSNGIFLEDEDRILFNSWNPYAQDSAYQNIRGFMDNYWYTVAELKEERFITISPSADGTKIDIANANDPYVGNTETGRIYIDNVPRRIATITINGRKYRQKRKGYFDEKIQYGWHRLRITYDGYPDYSTDILINAENPSYSLTYKPEGSAGKLKISNVSFRHWKVAVIDSAGKLSLYEGLSDINLKDGAYKVVVSSGGLEVKKDIVISADSAVEINVQKEIEAMFGQIPEVEGVQEALPEDTAQVENSEDATSTPTPNEAADTSTADDAVVEEEIP